MEEIVTIDGRQFKLTSDRPLTASEKAQAIADIRKQTGCGTCGSGRPLSLGDWQYGGIKSLAACPGLPLKASGDTIGLSALPSGGAEPYTVRFFRKSVAGAYTAVGAAQPGIMEAGPAATGSIALTDADIAGATGDATAGTPTTGTTGAIVDPQDSTSPLAPANIRVAATAVDSCPVPAGPAFCVQWCDVALTCPAPTCNFIVT